MRNEKNLTGFGRMFQTHIARIEVALRCGKDVSCYIKTLSMKPADAVNDCRKYIKDIDKWSQDEQMGLLEGEIERAMLELGKLGAAASGTTEAMLDAAKTDDRMIRQSILLALPKVAKVPCDYVRGQAQHRDQGGRRQDDGRRARPRDRRCSRNYFSWAGGRKPTKKDDGGGAAWQRRRGGEAAVARS